MEKIGSESHIGATFRSRRDGTFVRIADETVVAPRIAIFSAVLPIYNRIHARSI
jgi:hypothetical protein